MESRLSVPKTLCAPVSKGMYSSSSGFCHPVLPSSLRMPITLYAVPAIKTSLFNMFFTEVLSSFGTDDPITTTLFLPKFSSSLKILPNSISYPLTSK